MIDRLGDFGTWLQQHDLTIQIVVVWVVTLSSFAIAAGMITAWLTLRPMRDQTNVGRTLKWQKLAVSIATAANGIYWGSVLTVYYQGWGVSFWDRMILMVIFSLGMSTGAVFALLFAYYLRRESDSGDEGHIPLARDGESE